MFLLMLTLIALSSAVSFRISYLEEQACWETLYDAAAQLEYTIERQISSDTDLLETVADIIALQDSVDSQEVRRIIDNFHSNTMISYIALLLPGDIVILPGEPARSTEGKLSFEEEAALGKHISGRSTSIRDGEELVLRNFVPVIKDGETVGMLYGLIELDEMCARWESTVYDGKAAVYIMDGNTGDFLLDTWHGYLSNTFELGDREAKRGYSGERFRQDILDGNVGCSVFISRTIGEYLYFYYQPISINQWRIGISVQESVIFERLREINPLLFGVLAIEVLLMGAYLIWLWKYTKKELKEKQKLAETDVLTGLLNRNCYEKNLPEYPGRYRKSLTCIYIDVNGLHELNNRKGHVHGDKMLKTVGKAVQNRFGSKDTYRIGGDEFVAFVGDEETEEIRKKLDEITLSLQEKDYHVSIGLCRQELPVDMESLIKNAEMEMYQEKKKYYKRHAVPRRSRRI